MNVLKHDPLISNIGVLAYGTVIAKVVLLAFYPVITRIYSPEEFGIYSIFFSSILILYPIVTLYYQLTIPLPKKEIESRNIFSLVVLISLTGTIILALIFLLFSESIFSLLNISELGDLWWFLLVGLFFLGVYETISNMATREKKFVAVSISKIFQSVIFILTAAACWFLSYRGNGLVIAVTLQLTLSAIFMSISFRKEIHAALKNVEMMLIWSLLKKYRDYPVYRMPSEFMVKLLTYLPIFYYSYVFGSAQTGQIGLSLVIVAAPVSLLGQTIGKAYYAEISEIERHSSDSLKKVTERVFRILLFIGLAIGAALALFGPTAFKVIFGEEWTTAGDYARVLSLFLIANLCTTPIFSIFNVTNKQRLYFMLHLFSLLSAFVALGFSYISGCSPLNTLIIYVFIYTIVKAFSLIFVYKQL